MLPNHAPLVVAEQFGTLESLFPGRIDLGLGRAPGTDPVTTHALRRGAGFDSDTFPRDVAELQAYFRAVTPGQRVRAVPGAGLRVPIWILGSSVFGAQLAAELGLPFAFATHFAPNLLMQALAIYRRGFTPSESLAEPYVMLALPVVAAESTREARRLFTSNQQHMLNLRRGQPTQLPPPVDDMNGRWTPEEKALVEHTYQYAILGDRDTVRRGLEAFIERTEPNELMITCQVFDHAERRRSYELVAELIPSRAQTP
jgi:luciferase family oxidoreductase group 1